MVMPRGEWKRTNLKIRAEQVHQLDIRKMTMVSDRHTLIFRHGRNQTQYHVVGDHLIIDSHDQKISIEKTHCHYGGFRKWFLCPQCSKRIAILYELNNQYQCRKCHHLPYTSQRAPEFDRLLIKVRKIRDRMDGAHDLLMPVMFKPKGMHLETFELLKVHEEFVSYDLFQAMAKKLNL
jgi:hypothetical protein